MSQPYVWSKTAGYYIRSDLIEGYRTSKDTQFVLVKDQWHEINENELPDTGEASILAVVPALPDDPTRVLTWYYYSDAPEGTPDDESFEVIKHRIVAWCVSSERGQYYAPRPVWADPFWQETNYAIQNEDGTVSDCTGDNRGSYEKWFEATLTAERISAGIQRAQERDRVEALKSKEAGPV